MSASAKRWNLLNPTREISKLEHYDGSSTIEVKMVPGIGITLLFVFVIYVVGYAGLLKFLSAWHIFLITTYQLHPAIVYLATVPFFLMFAFVALYYLLLCIQYFRGTETIEIDGSTVKYTDRSRPKLNRTGALKSFRNISVRGRLGTSFLRERYGLVAELAGANIEFGVGLPEEDAERILLFITKNHPDVF